MAKDKIRAELVALADYATNTEDKKLCLLGIFDKLFVRNLPASHARLSFAVTLVGEPHTQEKMNLRIYSPSGKEEFTAEVNVNFGENRKSNLISNFEGFPIKETGTYRFVFEHDKKEVVSYGLDVIQVKDESTGKAN